MLNLPYKKLKKWQKGIDLVQEIYEITRTFPKEEVFGITAQMRRSAISIPSNIAEGSQRTTNKDFALFISIAMGSLAELETQIIVSEKQKYISKEKYAQLNLQIEELSKMLRSFYKKLTLSTDH